MGQRFKMHDHVVPAGVPYDSEDWDHGHVVLVFDGVVSVRWELADEVFDEDPSDLDFYDAQVEAQF